MKNDIFSYPITHLYDARSNVFHIRKSSTHPENLLFNSKICCPVGTLLIGHYKFAAEKRVIVV